jgi:hypothetical protein
MAEKKTKLNMLKYLYNTSFISKETIKNALESAEMVENLKGVQYLKTLL